MSFPPLKLPKRMKEGRNNCADQRNEGKYVILLARKKEGLISLVACVGGCEGTGH